MVSRIVFQSAIVRILSLSCNDFWLLLQIVVFPQLHFPKLLILSSSEMDPIRRSPSPLRSEWPGPVYVPGPNDGVRTGNPNWYRDL